MSQHCPKCGGLGELKREGVYITCCNFCEGTGEIHRPILDYIAELRATVATLQAERDAALAKLAERDTAHPWNVFKERDELQASLNNSIAEERRLRALHQQEFSRAEMAIEKAKLLEKTIYQVEQTLLYAQLLPEEKLSSLANVLDAAHPPTGASDGA